MRFINKSCLYTKKHRYLNKIVHIAQPIKRRPSGRLFIFYRFPIKKFTEPVAWHHSLWPLAYRPEWRIWRPAWQSRRVSGSCPCGRVCRPVCSYQHSDLYLAKRACRYPSLSGAGSPPACHCPPCRHVCWLPGHSLHQPRYGRPCCQPHCCADG